MCYNLISAICAIILNYFDMNNFKSILKNFCGFSIDWIPESDDLRYLLRSSFDSLHKRASPPSYPYDTSDIPDQLFDAVFPHGSKCGPTSDLDYIPNAHFQKNSSTFASCSDFRTGLHIDSRDEALLNRSWMTKYNPKWYNNCIILTSFINPTAPHSGLIILPFSHIVLIFLSFFIKPSRSYKVIGKLLKLIPRSVLTIIGIIPPASKVIGKRRHFPVITFDSRLFHGTYQASNALSPALAVQKKSGHHYQSANDRLTCYVFTSHKNHTARLISDQFVKNINARKTSDEEDFSYSRVSALYDMRNSESSY